MSVERNHADGRPRRLAECVERNPGNAEFFDRCCRFPKSCSPYPYNETFVRDSDLEPREMRSEVWMPRDPERVKKFDRRDLKDAFLAGQRYGDSQWTKSNAGSSGGAPTFEEWMKSTFGDDS